MTSADFDAFDWSVLNHHDAFLFLAGALEDDIGAYRLLDPDHLLYLLIIVLILNLYIAGKFSPANLALELGKIVMLSSSDHFFLDFYSNPFNQAFIMNGTAGAIAFAWVE